MGIAGTKPRTAVGVRTSRMNRCEFAATQAERERQTKVKYISNYFWNIFSEILALPEAVTLQKRSEIEEASQGRWDTIERYSKFLKTLGQEELVVSWERMANKLQMPRPSVNR